MLAIRVAIMTVLIELDLGSWELQEMQETITKANCRDMLKQILERAGVSPSKLARILDMAPSTLSHIRNGPRKPSTEFMNKLRALALLQPEGHDPSPEDRREFTVDTVVAGLLSLGRVSLLGKSAIVAAGAIAGGLLGGAISYGVLHAIDSLCRKNDLKYEEVEGQLEIRRPEDGTGQSQ